MYASLKSVVLEPSGLKYANNPPTNMGWDTLYNITVVHKMKTYHTITVYNGFQKTVNTHQKIRLQI